ncbi:MAG: response regulator transcription factor [Deltaproteobacteria bacterium]|nr:response regulator transcription factor [Deltaproteobacteria bacterium]
MKARILVVEDEDLIRRGLVDALKHREYAAAGAADGEAGLREAKAGGWDLILLDVMLPRIDGFSVCGRLRELGVGTPILMLTAKDAEDDKVRGLEAGADDYLTKPFGLKELMARVEALLRRARGHAARPAVLRLEGAEIDLGRRVARHAGREEPLTDREVDLLCYLCERADRVVTRDELLQAVWGYAEGVQSRTADIHLVKLRKKIGPDAVETARGKGYRAKVVP